ncbi:MAG: AAA family ATPase [Candidatus Thiodiazotropha sp.]
MAINKIYIENFKGVGEGKWVTLKPITVFVGANSSGKSTCIHALTCLSQTLKVSNNTTPLVLDDEYANVHLGRFIEVIHSKSYQDLVSLGVSIDRDVRNRPVITSC